MRLQSSETLQSLAAISTLVQKVLLILREQMKVVSATRTRVLGREMLAAMLLYAVLTLRVRVTQHTIPPIRQQRVLLVRDILPNC